MKKISITLAVLGLIIAGFVACKKTHTTENAALSEGSDEGLAVYQRMLGFKDAVKSDLKSDAVLPFDSAQWYTEAYYNVFHGNPVFEADRYRTDSLFYTLPVNNDGTVSMDALADLIETIEADIETITATGDVVIWGDIHFNSESEGNVTLYTGVGTGIKIPTLPLWFQEGECWYWGYTLGPCDGSPMVYSDAGEEIQHKVNYRMPVAACANGVLVITSVESFDYFTGLDFPNDIYYEWKAGAYNPPCLCHKDLNYWMNLNLNFLQSYTVNNPGLYLNKSVDYFTFCSEKTKNSVSGYEYYHGIKFMYYTGYYCLPLNY